MGSCTLIWRPWLAEVQLYNLRAVTSWMVPWASKVDGIHEKDLHPRTCRIERQLPTLYEMWVDYPHAPPAPQGTALAIHTRLFKSNYLTQTNNENNECIEYWLSGGIDSAKFQKHLDYHIMVRESWQKYYQKQGNWVTTLQRHKSSACGYGRTPNPT